MSFPGLIFLIVLIVILLKTAYNVQWQTAILIGLVLLVIMYYLQSLSFG